MMSFWESYFVVINNTLLKFQVHSNIFYYFFFQKKIPHACGNVKTPTKSSGLFFYYLNIKLQHIKIAYCLEYIFGKKRIIFLKILGNIS